MKSRTSKALVSAAFTYGQFFIAIGAMFFVTPLILRTVGARRYGIWLSSGEIIGYFLLLDFGVFSILPWLIARADGLKRTAELRRLLVQGLAIAVGLAVFLCVAAFLLWGTLPTALHLDAQEWHALGGPLGLLVILLAVNLPLNLFSSLLGGLQDVRFLGALNLAKAVLCPALTAGLLLSGHGFYALVVGTALLPPVGGVIAFLRARKIVPALLREWPQPTIGGTSQLFRESIGAWLGGAGVQLMERSSAIILGLLGQPSIIPTLVCTSRPGQILTQMAWVIPDSALVGLAQLSAENDPARLREVTLSIIRLNIVIAAGAACLVLALNPAFVRLWVGERYFGGLLLNFLLAVEIISASLNHSLATVIGVQGSRLSVGMATLLQGAIYIALALMLTRRASLVGLLGADLLAPLVSTFPVYFWLLRSTLGLSLRELAGELVSLLLVNAGPCLLAAWGYGLWRDHAGLAELILVGGIFSFIYLRVMSPLLATFPIPAAIDRWMRRLHLLKTSVVTIHGT